MNDDAAQEVIPDRQRELSTPLPQQAYELLHQYWGYSRFRPLQQQAISSVLNQQDSLAVMSTGAGKSLCYQLPALLMEGTAVIVSPLISLMKDQVDTLTSNGIAAGFINSSLTSYERMRIANEVSQGKLKLLYIAPERLCLPQSIEFLKNCKLSFFAIDEAHCISHWGHDFRPDYRQLAQLKNHFPGLAVHAFTATATRQVRNDIAQELHLQDYAEYIGSFDRPNLKYFVKPRQKILQQVLNIIQQNPQSSGIIYCISRKKTEELCNELNLKGIKARYYHAGLSDEDRKQTQEDFQKQRVDVIVATVAFGMGIDKSDVRYVIHVEAPRSLENYQQESGRAGRDGLPAECHLFYGPGDFITWKRMQSELPAEALNLALNSLSKIERFCQGTTCRHKALVEHFGQDYEAEFCNACDVCLDQQDILPDSLIISQKIISCVYRLQERFGAGYTASILHGSSEQRILELNHNKLSTYGLLSDFSLQTIRQWIEQLIAQQYLERYGEYQQLRITPQGKEVLKGSQSPRLLVPLKNASKKTTRQKNSTSRALAEMLNDDEQELFSQLRALRLDLARQKNYAPFMIFPDSTLVEMSSQRPQSLDSLSNIPGIGQKKLNDYGEQFLTLIKQFCKQHTLNENVQSRKTPPTQPEPELPKLSSGQILKALELFRSGLSVKTVAEKLDYAHSTVSGYLAKLIEQGLITDISPWVTTKEKELVEAILPITDTEKLKPIYEKLDGKLSYDTIKIIIALKKHQQLMQ